MHSWKAFGIHELPATHGRLEGLLTICHRVAKSVLFFRPHRSANWKAEMAARADDNKLHPEFSKLCQALAEHRMPEAAQ